MPLYSLNRRAQMVLRHLYRTLYIEAEEEWRCSQCPITLMLGNAWTNLDTHVLRLRNPTELRWYCSPSALSSISTWPATFSVKSHLTADAPIVHNRNFQCAVIKIQINQEDRVTTAEKGERGGQGIFTCSQSWGGGRWWGWGFHREMIAGSHGAYCEVEVSIISPHFSY